MYDYYEAIREDVRRAWEDDYEPIYPASEYNRDRLEEALYDAMWINDSVTGNGSGSYTFSTYKAEKKSYA